MLKINEEGLKELKEHLIKTISDYPIVREVRQHGNSLEIIFEQWIRFEDGTLVPHNDPVGPSSPSIKSNEDYPVVDYLVLKDLIKCKTNNKNGGNK